MDKEVRRVNKKNIWRLSYDIRPAFSNWQEEIKARLRPASVDIRDAVNKYNQKKYGIYQINTASVKPNIRKIKPKHSGRLNWLSYTVYTSIIILGLVIGQYYFVSHNEQKSFSEYKNAIASELSKSMSSYLSFDFKSGYKYFDNARNTVRAVNSQNSALGFKNLGFLATVNQNLPLKEDFSVTDLNDAFSGLSSAVDILNHLGGVDITNLKDSIGKLGLLLGDSDITNQLNQFYDLVVNYNRLIGFGDTNKYLVLITDPATIRPTGGMIGAYGIIDNKKSGSDRYTFGPVSSLDVAFTAKVIPPKELQSISSSWLFHDLNWFFDNKTSSSKILQYLPSTGIVEQPNTVLFANLDLIEKLLAITGPIDIIGGDTPISSGNFANFFRTELYQDKQLTSNKNDLLFGQFVPKFINRLKLVLADDEDKNKILGVLISSLNFKDLQIYSSNNDLEAFLDKYKWSGNIYSSSGDYLAVVNTNIASEGLDTNIKQSISLDSNIQSDGSIINNLILSRTNSAKGSISKLTNYDYVRIYLPLGSDILDAKTNGKAIAVKNALNYDKKGFTTDGSILQIENSAITDNDKNIKHWQENGKLVVSGWINVKPGQSETFSLRYTLPFKINSQNPSYNLSVAKQSGVDSLFNFNLTVDPNLNFKNSSDQSSWESVLNSDLNISVDLKPAND